ncbi:MAG TPA: FGLLP motif-containing membrane protein, partial [Candidatus Limnocylindria bacterium]|nr:FGLLP motif-containing membrane protein [Candidatus Limnocylindria bacterium]
MDRLAHQTDTLRTVRHPSTLRATLAGAALIALLAAPLSVLASHEPTVDEVVAIARNDWNMACSPDGNAIFCSANDFDFTWSEFARIDPASGPLKGVLTQLTVFSIPPDPFFRGWFYDLHRVPCLVGEDPGQLSAFIADVLSRETAGTVTPITIADECDLAGGLDIVSDGSSTTYTYWIRSFVLVPPATATPTPKPTPRPTKRPTPTPAPTASVTATPSASATASPSATPSGSPSPTPSASSSPTPEQGVLGGNPTPAPSAGPVTAPTGSEGSDRARGFLVASLPPLADTNLDPPALGASFAVALLLLLFMAFASELFNSTFESNYDEIAGWLHLRPREGEAAGRRSLWASPLGIGIFMALGAAVYLLLDPQLSLGLDTLAIYLGMLGGLAITMVAFELPGLLMYRRRTGTAAGVRALPWTLPAAIVCVAISRVAGLEPGYLYGILLGLVFAQELGVRDEGRQAAAGAAWTLAVALVAWIGLDLLRANDGALGSFSMLLIETALAAAVVGGLEAVAFGLLPMRFLAGASVYAWSHPVWALLFGISAFAFVHLLIGPHAGYLSSLSPAALWAAMGAFAAF